RGTTECACASAATDLHRPGRKQRPHRQRAVGALRRDALWSKGWAAAQMQNRAGPCTLSPGGAPSASPVLLSPARLTSTRHENPMSIRTLSTVGAAFAVILAAGCSSSQPEEAAEPESAGPNSLAAAEQSEG